MAKIIIKRNAASNKFCNHTETRQLGKAGRLARMFAKSHNKPNSKPKGDYRDLRTEILFPTVELNYTPIKAAKGGIHTVRAKEKIQRGCRELIRI